MGHGHAWWGPLEAVDFLRVVELLRVQVCERLFVNGQEFALPPKIGIMAASERLY
jgi:hypothetical protein